MILSSPTIRRVPPSIRLAAVLRSHFIFSNITGLDPSLQGFQFAHLYVSTTTTVPAGVSGGTLTQPLSNAVTVQIIRDTPAPVGVGAGSRTNLLTVVFSPSAFSPGIAGSDGGNSATLPATTPDNVVTFTSDFLGFGLTTSRNLSFSFSSVSPNFRWVPADLLPALWQPAAERSPRTRRRSTSFRRQLLFRSADVL